MNIKLTENQILQLAANAVNAAQPVGIGYLQHEEKNYTPEDMKECLKGDSLAIDYFHGRMTKLYVHQDKNGEWNFGDYNPTPEYQSWCGTYPTYQALVDSVMEVD